MVYDELAHGKALNGHILLGNHEFAHINGLMLATNLYLGQALNLGSLYLGAKLCPEWCPHRG